MARVVWYAVQYMASTRDIAALKQALSIKSPCITKQHAPQSFSPYYHMRGHGEYVAGEQLRQLSAKLGVQIVRKK